MDTPAPGNEVSGALNLGSSISLSSVLKERRRFTKLKSFFQLHVVHWIRLPRFQHFSRRSAYPSFFRVPRPRRGISFPLRIPPRCRHPPVPAGWQLPVNFCHRCGVRIGPSAAAIGSNLARQRRAPYRRPRYYKFCTCCGQVVGPRIRIRGRTYPTHNCTHWKVSTSFFASILGRQHMNSR